MELFSTLTLSSTTHYTSYSPTFSFSLLAGDSHPRFSLSSHNSSEPPSTSSSSSSSPPQFSTDLRRPKTTLKTATPIPKTPSNPLKNLRISQTPSQEDNLTPKLRLTTKLSTPPPPLNEVVLENVIHVEEEEEEEEEEVEDDNSGKFEFRQEGKIFVGNLPLWIKKPEVFEFFRQFGEIKSVILIKGHENLDRNLGFGFVIYGGPNAEKSALKAVEFDGMEFHGRVLTVKLDDGRRRKTMAEERERWVDRGGEGREYRSKWHEERDGCRMALQKVLDSQPENWQAVVRAFERIKKVYCC